MFYSIFFRSSNLTSVEQTKQIEKKKPLQIQKIIAISAIALTTLALAIWNIAQKNLRIAAAITIGGVCVEVAFIALWPARSSAHAKKIEKESTSPAKKIEKESTAEELTSASADLEACYPIKAIDPIQIADKQAGGMMGQACGDAIGLFTEFTTKEEAVKMIDGKPLNFEAQYPKKFINGYNWHHIERFIKNGWTDDTDQALSLLRALYRSLKLQTPLSFERLFANELKKWLKNGLKSEDIFMGRSNPYCMGLGALVSSVLNKPTFLKNPVATARTVWAKQPETPLQNRPAANGAIMRTAPIGLIFYRSFSDLISYTLKACRVTHADPRCIASCIAFNTAIALSLRGYDKETIFKAAEEQGLHFLHKELYSVAKNGLLSKKETKNLEELYETTAKEFKDHLYGNWKTLDLDEGYKDKTKTNKIGYTFKCMGAAFYALELADQYQKENKKDVFRSIVEEITAEGGDADTNAAAAGALLGAYLGSKGQFPANWTNQLADKPVMKQAIQHVQELSCMDAP